MENTWVIAKNGYGYHDVNAKEDDIIWVHGNISYMIMMIHVI